MRWLWAELHIVDSEVALDHAASIMHWLFEQHASAVPEGGGGPVVVNVSSCELWSEQRRSEQRQRQRRRGIETPRAGQFFSANYVHVDLDTPYCVLHTSGSQGLCVLSVSAVRGHQRTRNFDLIVDKSLAWHA